MHHARWQFDFFFVVDQEIPSRNSLVSNNTYCKTILQIFTKFHRNSRKFKTFEIKQNSFKICMNK